MSPAISENKLQMSPAISENMSPGLGGDYGRNRNKNKKKQKKKRRQRRSRRKRPKKRKNKEKERPIGPIINSITLFKSMKLGPSFNSSLRTIHRKGPGEGEDENWNFEKCINFLCYMDQLKDMLEKKLCSNIVPIASHSNFVFSVIKKEACEVEHSYVSLSCSNGQLLNVVDATYGRLETNICSSDNFDETCSDNVLSVVSDRLWKISLD